MTIPETWIRMPQSPAFRSWPATPSEHLAETVAATARQARLWSARQSSGDRTGISSDTFCPTCHPKRSASAQWHSLGVSERVEFNAPPDTIYVISEAEWHSLYSPQTGSEKQRQRHSIYTASQATYCRHSSQTKPAYSLGCNPSSRSRTLGCSHTQP